MNPFSVGAIALRSGPLCLVLFVTCFAENATARVPGSVGAATPRPLPRRNLPAPVAVAGTCGNGLINAPAEECEPGLDGLGQPLDFNCPGQCVAPGQPNECTCDRGCTLEDCEFCPVGYGVNGPFLTHGGMFTFVPDAPFALIQTCASDYDTELTTGISPACDDFDWYNDLCSDSTCAGMQHAGSPFADCYVSGCNCSMNNPPECPDGSCLCIPTPVGIPYNFNIGESPLTLRPPLGSHTTFRISRVFDCAVGPVASGACCNHGTGDCEDDVLEPDCAGNVTFTPDADCQDVVCSETDIPASSEWGLIVLALGALNAGVLLIRRGEPNTGAARQ